MTAPIWRRSSTASAGGCHRFDSVYAVNRVVSLAAARRCESGLGYSDPLGESHRGFAAQEGGQRRWFKGYTGAGAAARDVVDRIEASIGERCGIDRLHAASQRTRTPG
jgi:hypothetical protein